MARGIWGTNGAVREAARHRASLNARGSLAGSSPPWLRFIGEKKKIRCDPQPAIVTVVMRGVIVPAPVGAAKM